MGGMLSGGKRGCVTVVASVAVEALSPDGVLVEMAVDGAAGLGLCNPAKESCATLFNIQVIVDMFHPCDPGTIKGHGLTVADHAGGRPGCPHMLLVAVGPNRADPFIQVVRLARHT